MKGKNDHVCVTKCHLLNGFVATSPFRRSVSKVSTAVRNSKVIRSQKKESATVTSLP